MPGCGESEIPDGTFAEPLGDGGILRSKVEPALPIYHVKTASGPFNDPPSEDTNLPFVRDLTVPELEELIEKCVRRVLQGEDLKREWAKLQRIRESGPR